MRNSIIKQLILCGSVGIALPALAMEEAIVIPFSSSDSTSSEEWRRASLGQAADDGFYTSDSDISSQLDESVIEISQPSRSRKKEKAPKDPMLTRGERNVLTDAIHRYRLIDHKRFPRMHNIANCIDGSGRSNVSVLEACNIVMRLLKKEGEYRNSTGIYCLSYLVWAEYEPAYNLALEMFPKIVSDPKFSQNARIRRDVLSLFISLWWRGQGREEMGHTAKALVKSESKEQRILGQLLLGDIRFKNAEIDDDDISRAVQSICDEDPDVIEAGVEFFKGIPKTRVPKEVFDESQRLVAMPTARHIVAGLTLLKYCFAVDKCNREGFCWKVAKSYMRNDNLRVRKAALCLIEELMRYSNLELYKVITKYLLEDFLSSSGRRFNTMTMFRIFEIYLCRLNREMSDEDVRKAAEGFNSLLPRMPEECTGYVRKNIEAALEGNWSKRGA